MKYHVLHIQTDFAEEWQKDLFDQALCDLGVDTIDGEDYYIPSGLWETQSTTIQAQITNTEGAKLHSVAEVPDENWNAAWEAEHPVQELPLGVKIIPHCAFGAGYHETTSMMIDALIAKSQALKGLNVFDIGCGTGVLGIFAKKLGAEYVLALDIDDKSVLNTQENAALNGVKVETKLGNLSSLPDVEGLGSFQLLLANIHRNVLLEQMPLYAQLLVPGGELWISGFYESDCPALLAAAEANALHHLATHSNGEWRMMQFRAIKD